MGFARRGAAAVAFMVVASTVTVGLGSVEAVDAHRRPPPGPAHPITGVLAGSTMDGSALPCVAQADGVRVCQDADGLAGTDLRFESFDGMPLKVFVTLPPESASRRDGRFPLVVQNHGWAAPPTGPDDPQYGGPTARQWAMDGYAVVQFTQRGWSDSCGTPAARQVNPTACAKGWSHFADYRYEARDVQHVIGLLVDEGIADRDRVGVTGESFGGGLSLQLATLKDRVMNADGSLSRWTSPKGTSLRIAAAAPFATWSDLGYSLMPNGRTLDSRLTSLTADFTPPGVAKSTISNGLYLGGLLFGYYAPPGVDPSADIMNWNAVLTGGEPYDPAQIGAIAEQYARFRSPYYLLAGAYGMRRQAPAPMLLSNGFTDDVFPVDEMVRYYNLHRVLYPFQPISMFFADIGHQRASNKPADGSQLPPRIKAYFDHYVKGTGPRPAQGVTAMTQRCPSTEPSEGPYSARSWDALSPGEVRYRSGPEQVVLSTGGNPEIGQAFDPVLGGPACRTTPADNQGTGIASYSLPAATGEGYTLLGAPTVTANLKVTGEHPYVAARLLDVDPATNTQVLVSRGLYRIDPKAPNGRQTFQLAGNGYRFEEGHVPTLQLLGQDAPYSRPSNGQFSVAVSDLQLRLPVHEVPGARGTPSAVHWPWLLDLLEWLAQHRR